ncbi:MAG TPA: glycosyltransferase family 39 protein [Pseudolysinimonas sp.]|nr:glycosyltransferase family 39 protein [Pseudolysinimonas sp.]
MTSTIAIGSVASPRLPRGVHSSSRFAFVALGVLATGIALIGAGTPSYWGDEAASVTSALRPLPSLFAELAHVDAVHGLYYLFLHVWVGLVGTSEFAVRAPSAVAMGFAVAGTGVLGSRLLGRRVGIIAALVLTVLPEMTRMAIEARSYAFAVAAGVWLTIFLVHLVSREASRRWWVLFGVCAALCVYLFLYLLLLVVVHAVVVLAMRASRQTGRRWLSALAIAGVLALPVIVVAVLQGGQIEFLAHRHYATFDSVAVRQWFLTPWMAAIAWLLIAGCVVLTVLHRRILSASRVRGAIIALVWVAAPTALLLIGNAWLHPMYNMRYPAFCLPGVALAMAVGIDELARFARHGRARRVVAGLLLIAVAATAAPSFIAERGQYAKDGGSDLRQLAEQVHARAHAGDAIVFDATTRNSRRPRLALDLWPKSFAGLDDVELITPYVDRAWLWDEVAPLDQVTAAVSTHQTVWAVESHAGASSDLDVLARLGYRVVDIVHVHRTSIYELSREIT